MRTLQKKHICVISQLQDLLSDNKLVTRPPIIPPPPPISPDCLDDTDALGSTLISWAKAIKILDSLGIKADEDQQQAGSGARTIQGIPAQLPVRKQVETPK
ncbi:hypothetical protein A6R68_18994 [Neotoma lepida]|uniref:Uncharacterized protein n=1 Tax=Neotoma lepida TaxID=56216 RepID=A0A1A6HK12_NEOLE|nr:hypothetical protein A6R68_18994 [Neotoma lepida]